MGRDAPGASRDQGTSVRSGRFTVTGRTHEHPATVSGAPSVPILDHVWPVLAIAALRTYGSPGSPVPVATLLCEIVRRAQDHPQTSPYPFSRERTLTCPASTSTSRPPFPSSELTTRSSSSRAGRRPPSAVTSSPAATSWPG